MSRLSPYTMSTNSATAGHPPPTTVDVLDEIERLEQSITRTLQEIDQSFSDCQIIVSSKILPQIDRYAESSAEVWNHARLWLGFLEAAAAPSLPSAPRIRPPSRWSAKEMAAASAAAAESNEGQDDGLEVGEQSGDSREDRRISIQSTDTLHLEPDNDTNRQRISMFSLSPAGGLPDSFLGSSPVQPLPSPTPNSRTARSSVARLFSWDNERGVSSTPSRQDRSRQDATTLSTTPKGKPGPSTMIKGTASYSSGSAMQNPFTSSQPNGTPRKGVRVLDDSSRGMVVLDLDQDYQDVITPPRTLQFSVPESKVATTPRSVVEKSKIDRIFMKDGLVVPRPIFTRLEESMDNNSSAVTSRSQPQESADFGGSKKRRREGDHQGPGSAEEDLTDELDTAAWEQGSKSGKAKAIASPRKIPSTHSIVSSGSVLRSDDQTQRHASQGNMDSVDDEQVEEGSLSPDERLMESLREQSEQDERSRNATPARSRPAEVDDPILASLKTPPEVRQNLLAYKTRMSILPQASADPAQTTTKQQPGSRSQGASLNSQHGEANTGTITTTGADVGRTGGQATSLTSSATVPSANAEYVHEHTTPVVTSVPVSLPAKAGSVASTTTNDMAARSFASIFASNTTSSGSSASLRRQTLAVGAFGSVNNIAQGVEIAASSGSNTRASLGGGGVGFTNRPAFQAIQPPFSQLMNAPSIFATQQSRQNAQPSPASRAAAAAVAASALPSQWSTSTPTSKSAEQEQDRSNSKPQQHNLQDRFSVMTTPVQGVGRGARDSDGGGETTQVSSRGIYSASRPATEDTSNSILTPFSRRDPPPAPQLGYYSDTLMTQSSLGLNHDGFGPHSEEHTTTRTNIDSTTGTSRAATSMSGSRMMMPPPSTGGRTSGSSNGGTGGRGSSGSTADHSSLLRSGLEGDVSQSHDTMGSLEDDDTASYQIRSPCPPSRSGAGLSHQTLSLSAFRGGPFSKPK